jgi:hypothetical protein
MKVRISIPIDLRVPTTREFRVSKQVPDTDGGTSWKTVFSANALSGGEYLADLEPGRYQKTLATTDSFPTFSSIFEITTDRKYIDEEGNTFQISEDGELVLRPQD